MKEWTHLLLSQLAMNEGQIKGLPRNPRSWTRDQLERLKESIRETPLLLEARGLIVFPAKGEVRYADIRKDIDSLLAFPLAKASGYNLKSSENRAHFDGMTMAEYMRWLWNNPQAGQNLYRMFEGVVVPAGKDAEGNLIYKHKGGK